MNYRNIAITLIEGAAALSGGNECNRLFTPTIEGLAFDRNKPIQGVEQMRRGWSL